MAEVEPLPKTYQRGYRHVFASLRVKGAMPFSSTQQVDKGKEKVIESVIYDEDNHETEQEFQLIDLDEEDEGKITNAVIKGN